MVAISANVWRLCVRLRSVGIERSGILHKTRVISWLRLVSTNLNWNTIPGLVGGNPPLDIVGKGPEGADQYQNTGQTGIKKKTHQVKQGRGTTGDQGDHDQNQQTAAATRLVMLTILHVLVS